MIVFGPPTSRRIPQGWLELIRWCITSEQKNAGSKQWARFIRELRKARPDVTTMVSYSDPAQGHTGALYRACNWLWAPTWHRLRPPPTGNGRWSDGTEGVKDRWVYPVRKDAARVDFLVARDDSILRSLPWARYKEPEGADYKAFVALSASRSTNEADRAIHPAANTA